MSKRTVPAATDKNEPEGIIVTEAELRFIYRSAATAELSARIIKDKIAEILHDAGIKL